MRSLVPELPAFVMVVPQFILVTPLQKSGISAASDAAQVATSKTKITVVDMMVEVAGLHSAEKSRGTRPTW